VKDDAVYLRHVLEAIRRIEENTAGGEERFLGSHTLQDAVLRNLQTMAEATQRLSESAKRSRPEIDWRAIGAFRNVLVHNYLGIDLAQIWLTVQRDVPPLKTAVRALLSDSAV
jgi:uncharacterized protein with HEPN domain